MQKSLEIQTKMIQGKDLKDGAVATERITRFIEQRPMGVLVVILFVLFGVFYYDLKKDRDDWIKRHMELTEELLHTHNIIGKQREQMQKIDEILKEIKEKNKKNDEIPNDS